MLIYLLMPIFTVFSSFILNKKNNKSKKIFLSLNFFMMWLVSTFRNILIGTDTANYIDIFNTSGRYSIKTLLYHSIAFEEIVPKQFILLNKVLHIFGSSQIIILSFFSTVTFYFFAKAIYNISDNVLLTTYLFQTLYYFAYSLNASRQIAALSVSMYAFSIYIMKNKKMKSILLIVLSSFFLHPTSIVYFIIFPIRYLSRRPSFLSGLSILSIISSFFVKNYMYLLFALFPSFSRYQFNRFGQGIQFKGQIIIWVIEVLLIFYLLRLIKEESINLNEQTKNYICILFFIT